MIQFMGIAERIKELRERRGMSQSELARLVGVSPQSVQQWEKPDGTAPKRARIAKVAEVLGVSVPDIVTDGGNLPPMRKEMRALIERLITIGAADRIALADIDTLNRMLHHMTTPAHEEHPMRRESDWLIGGPEKQGDRETKSQ